MINVADLVREWQVGWDNACRLGEDAYRYLIDVLQTREAQIRAAYYCSQHSRGLECLECGGEASVINVMKTLEGDKQSQARTIAGVLVELSLLLANTQVDEIGRHYLDEVTYENVRAIVSRPGVETHRSLRAELAAAEQRLRDLQREVEMSQGELAREHALSEQRLKYGRNATECGDIDRSLAYRDFSKMREERDAARRELEETQNALYATRIVAADGAQHWKADLAEARSRLGQATEALRAAQRAPRGPLTDAEHVEYATAMQLVRDTLTDLDAADPDCNSQTETGDVS